MSEKTWDLVYSAIMDLTEVVKQTNEGLVTFRQDITARVDTLTERVDKGFADVQTRFDRVEERLDRLESMNDFTKIRLFDVEHDIRNLKEKMLTR